MPDQNSLAQRAETLLALHQPGDPVVLPTVWDAWSARLAVDAGFAALTVGSHPVADSVGKPDGEGMSFEDLLARVERPITLGLIAIFLAVGFLYWGHLYTSTTFILTGFFILYHFLFLDSAYRSRFYLAFLVSFLPFLLVNGVLTGGYTEQPVVIYNPEEYLGIRITSVPLDDAVYGFLLLFGVVTLYERWR